LPLSRSPSRSRKERSGELPRWAVHGPDRRRRCRGTGRGRGPVRVPVGRRATRCDARDRGRRMTGPYYEDDLVTLYHGDCREVTAWLEADILVTDPPYGIAYKSGGMGGTTRSTVHADEDTAARDDALT